MNYNQAVEKVKEYDHLIGEEIGEHTISHLVIVPSNRKHDGTIIDRIYWDKSTSDILSAHKDFEIIVLYDLHTDYRATGILVIEDLNSVISKLAS